MVFDVTKPAERTRLNSEQIRDNFEAVGRASDLKCFAQDPPDRTIYVQPGRFYTVTTTCVPFAGGYITIDTTTGGLAGLERVAVIELTEVAVLSLNYGAWAPVGTAVAPSYTPANIALAEVKFSYNDQELTDDQITDIRPLINLGSAGVEVITPKMFTAIATEGQDTFVISSFTYTVGAYELLVWRGGVYQTFDVDYTEVDNQTIQFVRPCPAGERVTIWKVGISVAPTMMSLYDLSDVSANEADGFHAADAATGTNPFLTVSGHAAIDHTTLPFYTPIGVHLTTIATGGKRHHALEIDVTDSFSFSSAATVQGVLNDVETNIYAKFTTEHKFASGEHGPKVTIAQSGADYALVIAKSHTGADDAVNISNSGSGVALHVGQYGTGLGASIWKNAAGTTLHVRHSSTAEGTAVHVEKYTTGSYAAFEVDNSGTGESILVKQTGNGKGIRVMQSGSENAVVIEKYSADASSALIVSNSGAGVGIYIRQSTVAGTGLRIDQHTADTTIFLNKLNGGAGHVINISNSGSGYDVRGNSDKWNVDKNGNANFGNVKVGGGTSVTNGFFTVAEGNVLTIASGQITPTHSYHRVDTEGGAANDNLDYINATGVPVGTILILQSRHSSRNVNVRNKAAGGNIDLHEGDDFEFTTTDDSLVLLRQSTTYSSGNWEWIELTRSSQE